MADQKDIEDHVDVMERATLLYVERDARHEGLWKEYGATDTFLHVRSKYLRTEGLVTRGRFEDAKEEAYDLLNYTIFLIRNIEAGRLG